MSAPPDAMTQMLQGLLGSDQSSAPQGGLMAAINQALAPYGGSNQVALQLLGNTSGGSSPMSVIGQSLQKSQQQSMQNVMQRVQLMQAMPQLQRNADLMQQLKGGSTPGAAPTAGQTLGSGPQTPGQPMLGPQPGATQGPPGALQQGQRPGLPVPQERQPAPEPTAYDVPSIAVEDLLVNGDTRQQAIAREQLYGKNTDPADAAEIVDKMQLQKAAAYIASQTAQLNSIINSDNPTQYVANDPGLAKLWRTIAPKLGMDPLQGFTPGNVRTAFAMQRNALLGWAHQPAADMPSQLKTTKLQDGRQAQIDLVTGKETILPDAELQPVMGPNGPTLVPKSQAAGMTPYSPSIAAAGSITDQAKEAAYQRFKTTGEMPAAARGGASAQIAYANYFAQRAAQDGDTGAQQAARSQQYKASQGVVKDFTSGKTAQTLNGLNTAIGHMDLLDRAATALQNNDIQGVNQLKNFLGTQFGNTNANNFNVIRDFAAGEVAKAVLPGGGGEGERDKIAGAIKSSNSPAQLHQAIADWKDLLSSKTDSIRNQWDVGTNGAQGSFDKFLLPATKKALGISDAPAAATNAPPLKNAQGWMLHTDKNGNMAYVSPDGKQYKEVQAGGQ